MSFFKNAKQSQTYRKVSAQITYFFLESSDNTLTWCSVTPESVQFSRSLVSDSATPWTAACQASPEYLTPERFSIFPANKDFLLFSHNTAITTWHCGSSLTTCPHDSFVVKGCSSDLHCIWLWAPWSPAVWNNSSSVKLRKAWLSWLWQFLKELAYLFIGWHHLFYTILSN